MSAEDFAFFKEREEQRKERRNRRLSAADATGWSKHSDTHWWRMVDGEKMHWWPSANKWLYRGKYYRGALPKDLLEKIT